jgi:hypothetical protein
MIKFETVFRWLLVEFNRKELFLENIKRDHADGKVDCYEGMLEEIVNSSQMFLENIGKIRKA